MADQKYEVGCPMRQRSTDEVDEELIPVYVRCDEPLFLLYQTGYTLSPGDLKYQGSPILPGQAHVQSWKIECANEHVLLTSDYQEDSAEFDGLDLDELVGLLKNPEKGEL